MAKLTAADRAKLPERAFAYIDSTGRRRLPIHDEAHVRNALARFDRVAFEDDAARDRARKRLLNAAKKHGIVPVGFVAGQIRSERSGRTVDFSAFPTGTVTFMLTDIEGSTRLLRRLEDGYAPLLREVRAMTLSAVRRAGGRKVDVHGDELLAVFERPAAAIEAAVDLQRAVAGKTWPPRAPVRVRVGIHVGRPTLTETGYVGLAVHTVARVGAVGHGGQILVSSYVRSAATGDMPDGVKLRSLGRHRLAGLPKPETLYQVEAKGLRSSFPPLRTASKLDKPDRLRRPTRQVPDRR